MRAVHKAALALAAAALGQSASAACYLVYAPDETIVFRSVAAPVDLSLPLHMTLPAVAPGGRMVFTPGNAGCEFELNKLDTLRQHAVQRPVQPRARRAQRARGA